MNLTTLDVQFIILNLESPTLENCENSNACKNVDKFFFFSNQLHRRFKDWNLSFTTTSTCRRILFRHGKWTLNIRVERQKFKRLHNVQNSMKRWEKIVQRVLTVVVAKRIFQSSRLVVNLVFTRVWIFTIFEKRAQRRINELATVKVEHSRFEVTPSGSLRVLLFTKLCQLIFHCHRYDSTHELDTHVFLWHIHVSLKLQHLFFFFPFVF